MARILRPLSLRSLCPHMRFSPTRYVLSNFDRIQIKCTYLTIREEIQNKVSERKEESLIYWSILILSYKNPNISSVTNWCIPSTNILEYQSIEFLKSIEYNKSGEVGKERERKESEVAVSQKNLLLFRDLNPRSFIWQALRCLSHSPPQISEVP